MPWVDFHTHILDVPSVNEARVHSQKAHVHRWLVNSVDLENWGKHLDASKSFPEAMVGVGWHPEQVLEVSLEKIPRLLEKFTPFLESASYLGETGLDFLYGKTEQQREMQQKVFSQFIDWSLEYDKMIQVHTRHAKQEAIDLLKEKKAKQVILHWFHGNEKQTKEIILQEWVCTVGPTILNSPHMDKFIQVMPLELLGLETDSPIPFDGKPSHPGWIPLVGRRVAEIKGVSLKEVERAQEGIFSRFFPGMPINPFKEE